MQMQVDLQIWLFVLVSFGQRKNGHVNCFAKRRLGHSDNTLWPKDFFTRRMRSFFGVFVAITKRRTTQGTPPPLPPFRYRQQNGTTGTAKSGTFHFLPGQIARWLAKLDFQYLGGLDPPSLARQMLHLEIFSRAWTGWLPCLRAGDLQFEVFN